MRSSLFGRVKSFFSSLFRSRKEPKKSGGAFTPVELSRPFTLIDDCNRDDLLFREIMEEDLKGLSSPLELMKQYADILNKGTSHGNIDDKLDRLFLYGKTPKSLDGYYHGVTISLKTGTDNKKVVDEIFRKLNISEALDPLQVLYGRLLS